MKIKYIIYINQLSICSAGLGQVLSLDDLALLDLVRGFEKNENSKKSAGYTWIDYRTASDQLPLARSLGSVSGVSRAIRRLVEAGLVETRRVDRAVYARSTARCRELLGQAAPAVPAVPAAAEAPAARQHRWPRRWPHQAVLDALLVDLPPADADAVVVLVVAASSAGKIRSVVQYAAGLSRCARDGALDTTTLPAVSARVLAETRVQPHAPDVDPELGPSAPGASSGVGRAAGLAALRAITGRR